MIAEIMDQVPKIQSNNAAKKNEEEPPYPGYPNHEKCIAISTEASLKKMIYPGCLVIISHFSSDGSSATKQPTESLPAESSLESKSHSPHPTPEVLGTTARSTSK